MRDEVKRCISSDGRKAMGENVAALSRGKPSTHQRAPARESTRAALRPNAIFRLASPQFPRIHAARHRATPTSGNRSQKPRSLQQLNKGRGKCRRGRTTAHAAMRPKPARTASGPALGGIRPPVEGGGEKAPLRLPERAQAMPTISVSNRAYNGVPGNQRHSEAYTVREGCRRVRTTALVLEFPPRCKSGRWRGFRKREKSRLDAEGVTAPSSRSRDLGGPQTPCWITSRTLPEGAG
jgi:hypothetical protein